LDQSDLAAGGRAQGNMVTRSCAMIPIHHEPSRQRTRRPPPADLMPLTRAAGAAPARTL